MNKRHVGTWASRLPKAALDLAAPFPWSSGIFSKVGQIPETMEFVCCLRQPWVKIVRNQPLDLFANITPTGSLLGHDPASDVYISQNKNILRGFWHALRLWFAASTSGSPWAVRDLYRKACQTFALVCFLR